MQLSEQTQKSIDEVSKSKISIYPKQQWVVCLGAATFNILKLKNLVLNMRLNYSAIDKPRKQYSEPNEIDFNGYRGFMVYISDSDELKKEVKNMAQTMNKISVMLKQHYKISEPTVETQVYWNIEDANTSKLITVVNNPEQEEN